MTRLRTGGLALFCLLAPACKDDEANDAGLFGDGGPGTPTDDGSASTTSATDDGLDDPPPPPPPPPPDTTGEDETSGGVDPGTDSSTSGSDQTTSSTTGEGSSDDADTFNDGTLDVEVSNQSMFPQGQCDDVLVTNISAMDVTWEVELPLPGTIDQVWNADVVEMPGSGVFTGVAFNATLAPGMQAMFGYCVLY